jgi:hypothetical protein
VVAGSSFQAASPPLEVDPALLVWRPGSQYAVAGPAI